METLVTQTPSVKNLNITATDAAEDRVAPPLPGLEVDDLIFELGLWLSGLESFIDVRNHTFANENHLNAATRDWTKEFRLTHSALLSCSKLNFQLGNALREQKLRQTEKTDQDLVEFWDSITKEFEISAEELYALSLALKDSVLLNESLLRAAPLKFGEWTAWSHFVADKLKTVETFGKLIRAAEKAGENFLPEILQKLVESQPIAEQTDLRLVLPRFAKILKWLSVVGRMLRRDEPLKPTLLIFSRVYEQIQELINYINNRLLRFPDEESALFSSLDGAAYSASIELKKVYNQELTGLVGIRSTPSVYARIETAYALLNDSFQQALIGFAQLIEPEIDPGEIFPNVQIKLERSLILRQDVWEVLQAVQKAEHDPGQNILEDLNRQLTAFLSSSLHFLFYKDKETLERFVEEILITKGQKDIVPILHRFGAYLETLFGQVNMRTVLTNHPFEY